MERDQNMIYEGDYVKLGNELGMYYTEEGIDYFINLYNGSKNITDVTKFSRDFTEEEKSLLVEIMNKTFERLQIPLSEYMD